MRKKFPRRIDPRVVALWLAAWTLSAAEHHGQVRFGGLPVPGATVIATQGDKRFAAVTDTSGNYSFRDLPDGSWTIQVEMLCFVPLRQEVSIAPGAPASEWDLKLLPFDEIKAVGLAPATPPAPVAPAQRVSTPPAPRGFQRTDLAASGDAGKLADESAATMPGDLSRSASDGFSIGGSVNAGGFSPFAQSQAFGNNRRGGRSLYNAALGVTLNNSALDAQSFSLTGQNTPKPAYNRLQGSASFGGPVRIPHLVRGNSLNFFAGYQWTRNRNASTQSSRMPTVAERGGNLGAAAHVFDPMGGAPFPDGVIPSSRISPEASALLHYYPLPNFDPAARYNYQVALTGVSDEDSVQTRLSKSLGRKNQVFGSFAWQRTSTDSTSLFGFRDETRVSGFNAGINWSHRFSPRVFSLLKYEYSRQSTRVTPFFANRTNVSAEAGIGGNNQDPLNWGPPSLNFASGVAGLSDARYSFMRNQTGSVSADTYWNRADHNFKFGGDFRRQQINPLSQQDARGAFTFTGAAAGSDLGGFLLGIPDTSSIAFGNADKYYRASIADVYFTDDWRINAALTVNAGLRWEYGAPIVERYGRLVNLDIAPGFAAVAPVVGQNPVGSLTHRNYPESLVQPDKRGIEPRVGVAWRPIPASSLVIRAGYGINRNTSVYQSIASRMAQQAPLSKSLRVQNAPGNPLTLANGFIGPADATANTFAIDPDFRVGYAQTWQASIQRDLPAALVMTATYLGIKGTRAMQEFLPNTFPAGAPNPCAACPAGYTYMASNGNSTRNAGQAQLRRRLRTGFTATLQYTYSKSIDNGELGGKDQGGALIAQNWLDLRAERGLSNFDQRHLLAFQTQYTTGMGIRGGTLLSGWRGTLLKDWTIATQITAGSGLPLTPVYLAAVRGTGVTGSIRPRYTGADLYAAPSGLFLNPAAYDAPLPGQWGNAGRNSITGPSRFVLDASLGRSFPFRDHGSIDLRLDAANALNHVTYPNWNTMVTSAQFGLPTVANAMRSVRANLRVRF